VVEERQAGGDRRDLISAATSRAWPLTKWYTHHLPSQAGHLCTLHLFCLHLTTTLTPHHLLSHLPQEGEGSGGSDLWDFRRPAHCHSALHTCCLLRCTHTWVTCLRLALLPAHTHCTGHAT